MPSQDDKKQLSEMTADEIAQLSPARFKELADSHNDALELRENARNRELETEAVPDFNPLLKYDLPNHDKEVDALLDKLVQEPKPSLVERIAERIKQVPANVRALNEKNSGYERGRSLDEDDPRRW